MSGETGGSKGSRAKRGGRGDAASDAAPKWKPKASGSETDGTTANVATAPVSETPLLAEAAALTPAEPCAAQEPNGHTEARPTDASSANGPAGTGTNGRASTRGDQQKGARRGGDRDRSQANAQSSSAASSSGSGLAIDNGDFPGLPSGDAPRSARPALPASNDSADGDRSFRPDPSCLPRSSGMPQAEQSPSQILAQQLKNSEHRQVQRDAAVMRLRGEIRRLQEEAQEFTRQERRLQAESVSIQEQAAEQVEKLRERHADLRERLKDERQLCDGCEEHSQWKEELDSMRYQKDAACEQNEEMARSIGIWKKAATEQVRRLRASEAKLKSLEAIRVDHRSQHKKLEAQALEFLQVKEESLAAGQELRKELDISKDQLSNTRQVWQALCPVLLMVLLYLLFSESWQSSTAGTVEY